MLELFGHAASINVRKVLWTLEEIGIEAVRYDVGGVHASPDTAAFRTLNPNAQVPVLRDGDVVLWESNTLCRYLAARAGRTDLLPQAPAARARVEQWMDWQASELNPAWRYAFTALVRRSPSYVDPVAIDASMASWNRCMGVLEGQLASTGHYVLGGDFTLADVVLGLSVHRWLSSPIERPSMPAVLAYHARLRTRAAFLRHGDNGLP
ncbi:MAG TPA: glutathione S-transferase [Stenotrophomonas sp.]|jgi:glutathione S-transferase